MVLDSSAVIAILLGEPEAGAFEEAIQQTRRCLISAASVLECTVVLRKRLGGSGVSRLDKFIAEWPVSIREFDRDQLDWARFALETYGRGQHPAKLNFGDCFSYALAKSSGEPILFKGADFSLTDLVTA
jgi:ribonuclease VapC